MIGQTLIEPYLSRLPDELRVGLLRAAARNVIGERGKGRAQRAAETAHGTAKISKGRNMAARRITWCNS